MTMTAAVLVGYNKYKNYPEDSLLGCVPDCDHIHRLLASDMAWTGSNLTRIKDAQGGAAREKAAVLAMVTAPGPARHQVWSHSSHGSNNPDPGQADGLEELLCCYDLAETKQGFWDENTCITAKWIGQLVAQVRPGDTLDILLDCCNAPEGSQLKAIGRRHYAARFFPRPQGGSVIPRKLELAVPGLPPNVALWSACEPAQTSADANIGGGWQGAFTAAFLNSWKKGRSRSDIIYHAKNWLNANRYAQVPHLYCGKGMAAAPFGA